MKPLLYVVGDSISMHYGPYLERYLAPRFRYGRKSGIDGNLDLPEGVNVANGGDSSRVLQYLRYLRQTDFHADIFLINCGLHDIKFQDGANQIPLKQYESNLREILPLWRELATHPRWVRTTPVDDALHAAHCQLFARRDADVMRYNACADAIMREHGVEIIDLNGFTAGLDSPYCDHVHFSEDARALQAAFIAGAVWNLAEPAV